MSRGMGLGMILLAGLGWLLAIYAGDARPLSGQIAPGPSIEKLLEFDPQWQDEKNRIGFIPAKNGFILPAKIGEAQGIFFPAVLDSESPIILKTRHGGVSQYPGGDDHFRAETAGRYLIYRGKTVSILYRFDPAPGRLREFVYLGDSRSLPGDGTVIQWRFEGAELSPRPDGSVALVRKRDFLKRVRKIADAGMARRVGRFIAHRMGRSWPEAPARKILFLIPPPEFVDASFITRTKNIGYEVHQSQPAPAFPGKGPVRGDTLHLVINPRENFDFPLWVDPTLTADTSADFVIDGQDSNDSLGYSVGPAGDFNGDGIPDVIVGAPFDDNNGQTDSGSAFIFFGRTPTGPLSLRADSGADVILNGQSANDQFGRSVDSAGDFNGDGKSDVIVGAPLDGNNGTPLSGSAFIFFGRTPIGQLTLRADSGADVIIDGQTAFDQFGSAVSSAGDFNGDGKSDVIAGAPFDDNNSQNNSGSAFVFFGRTTAGIGQLHLSTASGVDVILDGQTANDQFGASVSSAGYFNGDGKSDVIVGDRFGNSAAFTGNAYIFLGRSVTSQVSLRAPTDTDVLLTSQGFHDFFGDTLTPAGDFDGDGFDDVIVGASGGINNMSAMSGRAYIFRGRNDPPPFTLQAGVDSAFILEGSGPNDEFGFDVAPVGDMNNDGRDDVIVGARWDDNNSTTDSGSGFVFFGQPDGAPIPPIVSFSSTLSSGPESIPSVLIPVILSSASASTVTVGYSVTSGTATGGGADFNLPGSMLVFNPGETSKNLSLQIIDDIFDEIDETLIISLSNPANANLISNNTFTYTIQDDDPVLDLTVHNARSVVAPYWQADPIAYTFMALSHPSLAGMNSEIGVVMTARFGSLNPAGLVEFTIRPGQTRKVFITQTGGALSQGAVSFLQNTGARVLVLSDQGETNGNLQFTPKASNPEIMPGTAGTPGRGFPDITSLNYWGAVVVAATSTGFAMEFVGDGQNSRAFNTPFSSGLN